jgi:hypothetical protein
MEKFKHYVYIYLDPRKPGKYEYFDQGLGISFDFEPFYLGEGCRYRMKDHLKQARNDDFENTKCNKYKIRIIRKIWRMGLEPIVYKIFEFQDHQSALDVERTLGFLIGRYDQKRGPLTNLVDCGGKSTNFNSEAKIKRNLKIKELRNNESLEQVQSRVEKTNKTKLSKPKKERDRIVQDMRNTKIKNNKVSFKNHPCYILLDYAFLINSYFSIISRIEFLQDYNNNHSEILGLQALKKFYKILDFPVNTLHSKQKTKKNIYLDFVKENKHKIQWYIENYERLEEEYYERKWKEKYKDILSL